MNEKQKRRLHFGAVASSRSLLKKGFEFLAFAARFPDYSLDLLVFLHTLAPHQQRLGLDFQMPDRTSPTVNEDWEELEEIVFPLPVLFKEEEIYSDPVWKITSVRLSADGKERCARHAQCLSADVLVNCIRQLAASRFHCFLRPASVYMPAADGMRTASSRSGASGMLVGSGVSENSKDNAGRKKIADWQDLKPAVPLQTVLPMEVRIEDASPEVLLRSSLRALCQAAIEDSDILESDTPAAVQGVEYMLRLMLCIDPALSSSSESKRGEGSALKPLAMPVFLSNQDAYDFLSQIVDMAFSLYFDLQRAAVLAGSNVLFLTGFQSFLLSQVLDSCRTADKAARSISAGLARSEEDIFYRSANSLIWLLRDCGRYSDSAGVYEKIRQQKDDLLLSEPAWVALRPVIGEARSGGLRSGGTGRQADNLTSLLLEK